MDTGENADYQHFSKIFSNFFQFPFPVMLVIVEKQISSLRWIQCVLRHQISFFKTDSLRFCCMNTISCTVRWQGTWKLVHGCGESCCPEPTAVANHVAPSRRRGGNMIRHSREQVSKSPAT